MAASIAGYIVLRNGKPQRRVTFRHPTTKRPRIGVADGDRATLFTRQKQARRAADNGDCLLENESLFPGRIEHDWQVVPVTVPKPGRKP